MLIVIISKYIPSILHDAAETKNALFELTFIVNGEDVVIFFTK